MTDTLGATPDPEPQRDRWAREVHARWATMTNDQILVEVRDRHLADSPGSVEAYCREDIGWLLAEVERLHWIAGG